MSVKGSSPLTRGKRQASQSCHRCRGIIPAHAGKTDVPLSREEMKRDHPRSRGENGWLMLAPSYGAGSSPLTRGKLTCAPPDRHACGIIPAHAGKTRRSTPTTRSTRDHPRSRGENAGCDRCGRDGRGSSPLTRGKRCPPGSARGRSGIIPAHAGKTLTTTSTYRTVRDHPRSRGENMGWDLSLINPWGSSPLTRGKQRPARHEVSRRGIIPAHAGKTRLTAGLSQRDRDHPRSRGENFSATSTIRNRRGSSPLTRGKLAVSGRREVQGGIIPAHAGKTCSTGRSVQIPGDHPRSRGENRSEYGWVDSDGGSSPLTRGKRFPSLLVGAMQGIIPAHAGKTIRGEVTVYIHRDHPRSRGENPSPLTTVWRV